MNSILERPPRRVILAICISLVALTWIVFGQAIHHQFVNYDDQDYVYKNPHVTAGFTLRGLAWAFTTLHANNWHPLTWISHMLDCQLFALNPAGHHFTNVLLHTVAVLLLFLFLFNATRAVWPSAFVAALFAVHPLRAESVAWIAERKDVLSAVFFMLTLLAYLHYARRPSLGRYLTMSIVLALGLMAKPMLVTLPIVLLLLDYWPLARSDFRKLLVEKIPLIALSILSCLITIKAQATAIGSEVRYPLLVRLTNAFLSPVIYLKQMFWPHDLAVFYPFPNSARLWQGLIGGVALLVVTIVVLFARKRRPYLLTGWLWYVIMLIPVAGLMQVGMQAHADRYTYLPQIGISLLFTWLIVDLSAQLPYQKYFLGIGGAVVIGFLSLLAWKQTSYWADSESLWTHALAATSNNGVAEDNLGKVLFQKGGVDQALIHFSKARDLRPNSIEVRGDLANALAAKGRFDEATVEFEKALSLSANPSDPKIADVHYNLGNVLRRNGRLDDAVGHYEQAIAIAPDYQEAHYNLANTFREQGKIDSAIAQYEQSLQIDPAYAEAHNNLGLALVDSGRASDAIAQFREAVEADPKSALYLNNLAWQLATCPDQAVRNGPKAVALATKANQLSGNKNPVHLNTLAAAYAENGQFPEAIETVQQALSLIDIGNDPGSTELLHRALTLYKARTPYRSQNP